MSKFFAKPFGIGIGYRHQLKKVLDEHAEGVGTLEILIDKHFQDGTIRQADILRNLSQRYPLLLHGVSASLWSTAGPSDRLMRSLDVVAKAFDMPYYSDHCALTRSSEVELGHLSPNHASEEMLDITLNNIRRMRDRLGVPIVVENITYHLNFPSSRWSAEDFFLKLVHADPEVGILLDLTNLFINSQNHGYNPYAFIDRLPMDRIVQIHLAGGHKEKGKLVDSHAWPVHHEAFDLLAYLLPKSVPDAIIIERDNNFNCEDVAADLARIHGICSGYPQLRTYDTPSYTP